MKNQNETVKNLGSWSLPEGMNPKDVFFRHSSHKNAVRFTVCGIYNPDNKQLSIGVCSHNTVKYGSMCKAVGRKMSFERALESPIMLLVGNSDPAKVFQKMFDIFANQKMVEVTKTEAEMMESTFKMREAKNAADKNKERMRLERALAHEKRRADSRLRTKQNTVAMNSNPDTVSKELVA